MTNYRLESKREWRPLMRSVQQAPVDVLADCLQIIRSRSIDVLSSLGWKGSQGVVSNNLRAEADAADTQYLDALDEAAGVADDRVLAKFAIARALSALAWTTEAPSVAAVFEGAYELSVTSNEQNAGLRHELEATIARGCT